MSLRQVLVVSKNILEIFGFLRFESIKISQFLIIFEQCQISERVKVAKGKIGSSTLKAGDVFGDEIMMDRQKYSDTVVSLQTVTGWKISKEIISNLVPIEKLKKSV